MFKKCFCAVLIFAALFTAAQAESVSAQSAILLDADTGAVLYEKNADQRRLIASTTKIMTALVVLDRCDLADIVKVPVECEYVGGSSMYLRGGEEISVEDLLYGLLLMSGNDAGLALAYHCGGEDVEAFVVMMNMYAENLGLGDTSFENPHGLDGEKNYSTAKDMALLAAHAMENETFYEIVSTKEATVAGRAMRNHNKLLWQFEGVCGIKTGFTKAAGRCLVSCAQFGGRRLIAVTLSAPDDWHDHSSLYSAVFDALEEYTVAQTGVEISQVPLASGGSAPVVFGEDLRVWLTPYEKETARIHLHLPPFVYQYTRGEPAGRADIYVRGYKIGSVALYYK